MSKDNGGPAYPTKNYREKTFNGIKEVPERYAGMTLRDWFAGQALAGILAGGFADTIPHDDVTGGQDAAAFAYQYADAMIAERGL